MAVKYDAGGAGFDPVWYNVSTLAGSLAENSTTETPQSTESVAQKNFAAVRDWSGNLHAVYVNRDNDAVHYKKAVGFNDSWSRVSSDVTVAGASAITKVALTAAAGDNLFLFYEKNDNNIYYRRFDGSAWGPETFLLSSPDLRQALAPAESTTGGSPALAWAENLGAPYDGMFSLEAGSYSELLTEEGAGTITVTAPQSFEMTFDTSQGGALSLFYDLVDDPSRTYDLAGGVSGAGVRALYQFLIFDGVSYYQTTSNADGPKLDLLESTPTRVKVRQEAFFQQAGTSSILGGVKGFGDYTIYPVGRMALRWNRKTSDTVNYNQQAIELVVHQEFSLPLSTWSAYRESGGGVGRTWG